VGVAHLFFFLLCLVLPFLVFFSSEREKASDGEAPVAKDNFGNPDFGTTGGCWGHVKMPTERCDTKTRLLHARFLIRSNTWHGTANHKARPNERQGQKKDKVKRKTRRQALCPDTILISFVLSCALYAKRTITPFMHSAIRG
jgi:hypothetical protein